MSHAVDLALVLDKEMLGRHGVTVAPPWTPDHALAPCRPSLVDQLGHRFLLKYLRRRDAHRYSRLSGVAYFPGKHFVTPTVICRDELVSVLNLPATLERPRFALILDPAKLDARGPREIRGGKGVEYFLPDGFPVDAIVDPGWPVEVR